MAAGGNRITPTARESDSKHESSDASKQITCHDDVFAATLFGTAAHAIEDHQQQAIERLGTLNGIALRCGYYHETKRLKEAIVANVPKVRALGALFEDATNTSFMNSVEKDSACPGAPALARDIDEGISALRSAFADK